MKYRLDNTECRVLGALIEKDLATPEYYPLTLNSLGAACNQKSNRDPVMSFDETTVRGTVQRLVTKHLARPQFVPGSRTEKYGHTLRGELSAAAPFSREELAVIAELLLRGAQTPGELRTHAGRMAPFDSLDAVMTTLRNLRDRPDGPYVEELPREPGKRETRFRHLFNDNEAQPVKPTAAAVSRTAQPDLEARVEELENRLARIEEMLNQRHGE